MDKEELDNVIALHARWLETGGQQGRRADFEDADLRQADMRGADLRYASFVGANLERAELAGARLAHADLSLAALGYADLTGANLASANLDRAFAIGADFTRADLTKANLKASRFDHASLREAALVSAIANKADFVRCDLSGARLDLADLQAANFKYANLSGVTLSAAQRESLSASPTFQTWPDADTDPKPQRRLMRITQLLGTLGVVATFAGIAVGLGVGVVDLYLMVRYGTTGASTGFNYAWPFVVSGAGLVMTVVAVFVRPKIVAEMNKIISAKQ
jgi:uncharacterized protein YjbI with pentapeptide repeats